MRVLVFVVLLEINAAAAAFHSLRYFYTGSSEVPNFPEFVAVGLVDEVPFIHYDSKDKRVELKQDWMKQVIDDDPNYLERNSQNFFGSQQVFKNNIDVAKQRFNQTGGVHTFQRMYGCEWDDETEEVKGYHQYAYDGEDFIALDLKTLTYVAAKPQAVITKHKWESDVGDIKYYQHYLNQICPEWLKKHLNYGKNTLLRTELPTVSLLQKTSTSPIVCHATGFFPRGAMLFWTKDGEEVHEDIEVGEVLPNPDGTFQMMAQLTLSDPSEDWRRYKCVFQLAGVEEDKVTVLDKDAILSNRHPDVNVPAVVGGVVVVAVLVLLGVTVGILMKKRAAKRPPSSINTSEDQPPLMPETRAQVVDATEKLLPDTKANHDQE